VADPQVDTVVVAYPTFLHADLALHALRAGKHVVVEKPIAETYEEAHDMIDAARRAGRLLLVCQLRRFWPTYAEVKRFVASGEVGEVHRLTFDFQACWSWANRGWRIERPGGYFLDMHVHEVDLLSWWAGASPIGVMAAGQNQADREATVLLRYPNALGQISYSGRVPGKNYPTGSTSNVQVVGDDGWAEVALVGGTVRLTTCRGGTTSTIDRTIGEENAACWDRMWTDFTAALRNEAPPPLTPEEAGASLRAALAAVTAMEQPREVELPGPPVLYSA